MWLYVPNTSTSSPSAQAEPASISASSWQFQALEQSAWSRGKPSRSRNWYQLWKRASWVQRLYGAMPEPSMAAHGVELWTASLVASRVSLTALPVGNKAALTSETYGAQRAGSSSNRAHGSHSSKTWEACSRPGMTKSLALKEYSETFQSLVLRLREDCSRREKSARRTAESAFSFSQWPTASASFNRADDPERFKQRAARLKDKHGSGNGAGMTLATAANAFQESAWPTPAARDYMGANSAEHIEAGTGRKHLDQLPNFVAHLWQTPRSHEVGQYQYSRGDKTKPVATLTGQAFSHPVLVIETVGEPSSNDRRILNPRFVEWLMGWPPRWTSCACSGTELSRFKQRMRSALLLLGLPREAPPAQLALFG